MTSTELALQSLTYLKDVASANAKATSKAIGVKFYSAGVKLFNDVRLQLDVVPYQRKRDQKALWLGDSACSGKECVSHIRALIEANEFDALVTHLKSTVWPALAFPSEECNQLVATYLAMHLMLRYVALHSSNGPLRQTIASVRPGPIEYAARARMALRMCT